MVPATAAAPRSRPAEIAARTRRQADGKAHCGFPLWGKLSPQVTDEGVPAGHFPLIRRVPRHLPPRGRLPAVGAGQAPPATIYYNEYYGLGCRGGIYAARCSRPDFSICRVNATGEQCSPLQPNRQICANRTIPLRGNKMMPPFPQNLIFYNFLSGNLRCGMVYLPYIVQ